MLRGASHRYRAQWLMLGAGLLMLGAFIGYSLYLEYHRVGALESDRLQAQARSSLRT